MIYKAGAIAYKNILHILALFHPKAKAAVKGRKGWAKRLKNFSHLNKGKDIIWMHCASTGEFEQGRPLLERLKKEQKEIVILLTFFSPSGYEAKKNYSLADHIDYLPFDSKKNANRFLNIVKPQLIFFVKYEFWPFFLGAIKSRALKLYLISGIFRSNQLFFKSPNSHQILSAFTHFYLQDKDSAELLNNIGYQNTSISGDCRLDRVIEIKEQSFSDEKIEQFSSEKLLVAGSTWPKDQELLIDFIRKHASWKLLIIPHELDQKKLLQLREQLNGLDFSFYSELSEEKKYTKSQVMVVDTMGMLSKLYRYAKICYVGGGFGKGIHNTLEAAVYQRPVFFGPNYKKFKEAKDLIQVGAAFSVKDSTEFENTIQLLLNEKALLRVEKKAADYIGSNLGATKIIMQSMEI